MYTLDDTIVAISTPLGESGIGIVRLSGPDALSIGRRVFSRAGSPPEPEAFEPFRLYHGYIVDPQTGHRVDEVLVSYMAAPHSYTRQDVLEVNAHGGYVPLREIVALCLREGARPARPGEFTLRAFLNGRLDLAQAEAVRDVIAARTEASLRVAVEQLRGHLSQQTRNLRRALLTTLAQVDAGIDFPDDEIPSADLARPLRNVAERLDALLADAERGLIYRQGVRVAIVGRPNVGKSSLLNRLLGTERAIVTPIPGTTRDTVEETVTMQGVPVVLVDTAGITAGRDVVESLGVERSQQAIARADLIALVVDGSTIPSAEDYQVAKQVATRPTVVVVNKADLPPVDSYAQFLPRAPHVHVSALDGRGLSTLVDCLVQAIFSGDAAQSTDPLVSDPRHRDLLRSAREALRRALVTLEEGGGLELVAVDLRDAVQALGEITGETASDDLLDTIFSTFCIGK